MKEQEEKKIRSYLKERKLIWMHAMSTAKVEDDIVELLKKQTSKQKT
jgi:hypothetical protein